MILSSSLTERERERERESSLNISDDFPPSLLLSARPFLVKSRKCNFSPRDRTEVNCLSALSLSQIATPCRDRVGESTKHFIGSQFRNLLIMNGTSLYREIMVGWRRIETPENER